MDVDELTQDGQLGQQFEDRLGNVLARRCTKELERVLRLSVQSNEHLALRLHFLDLAQDEPELADTLLKHPQQWLSAAEDLILQSNGMAAAQQDIVARLTAAHKQVCEAAATANQPSPPAPILVMKHMLHLRMIIPPDPDYPLLSPRIGAVGCTHINHLVVVSGTVVRTGGVKMCKVGQEFVCTKCQFGNWVRCKLEEGCQPPMPEACNNPHKACTGSKFKPGEQLFTGFQEIKVQEKSACLAMGALPASLPIVLQHEQVDTLQCGDDVEVCGVITCRWQAMVPGQRCEVELALVANHVQVLSKRQGRLLEVHESTAAKFMAFWEAHKHSPLTGRNKILASICPQIHGMFIVKLAVALALTGGVARPQEKLRGDVHLLLIGDPGIGKSQLMKFAAQAAHRSVTASGRGTSGAGLTAAAIKDGPSWVLEAGALVLADGGLCCIDEFDGIKEADRAMIHEAMEQQTVHVAKAGMVTTLSTRTTVVAAVNPKPGWKPSQPLIAATNISGPLLSRFDVVLLLLDVRHPERDRRVASCVLNNHQQGALAVAAQQSGAAARGEPQNSTPNPSLPTQQLSQAWSLDILRAYLLWAKATWQPVMTQHAEEVLMTYYQVLRQNEERSAARTTIRMLESLVRVAQAHARLCARSEVTRQDAVVAVLVVDVSQGCLHVLSAESALGSDFSEDPDAEYQILEQRVLRELGLTRHLPLPAPDHRLRLPAPRKHGVHWGNADVAGMGGQAGQQGWAALQTLLVSDRTRHKEAAAVTVGAGESGTIHAAGLGIKEARHGQLMQCAGVQKGVPPQTHFAWALQQEGSENLESDLNSPDQLGTLQRQQQQGGMHTGVGAQAGGFGHSDQGQYSDQRQCDVRRAE